MPKLASKNGRSARFASTTKYDAHHNVLSKTYGALADLRRELADSKTAVAEREELLKLFSSCVDSQRAWLLLEDYFEKLSLSRKDFASQEWWPRLLHAQGQNRLEELAILFLRSSRPLPTELVAYANADRFAEIEQAEQEQKILTQLENWLCPPAPAHLDSPRASLRVLCQPQNAPDFSSLNLLAIRLSLFRPRTGEKIRPYSEIIDLTHRAAHEQELFSPEDWEFIQWLTDNYKERENLGDTLIVGGLELLQWLSRWGNTGRLEMAGKTLRFSGQIIAFTPHLENGSAEISFTQRLTLPDGSLEPLTAAKFFSGRPPLALVNDTFYLLRNTPPAVLLDYWNATPAIPVRKLSYRLRTHLRKTKSASGIDWEQLCIAHKAVPQFVFELNEETVRLRLRAQSERDQSAWCWTGQEWQRDTAQTTLPRPVPKPRSRKSSKIRGWMPPPIGCGGSIGSPPNRDCGWETRTRIFSTPWPQFGRTSRRKPSTWAIPLSTGSSFRLASCARN
jgi:hypothetical protein